MSANLLYLRAPAFQMITVTKETGLGLKILGGINRNEGPFVYIQEIISGGDCYKVKMKIKIALHQKKPKSLVMRFAFLLHQYIFNISWISTMTMSQKDTKKLVGRHFPSRSFNLTNEYEISMKITDFIDYVFLVICWSTHILYLAERNYIWRHVGYLLLWAWIKLDHLNLNYIHLASPKLKTNTPK